MIPAPVLMTAEDLLTHPAPHSRTELVNGRLMVREPAGWTHGDIAARIMGTLAMHLRAQQRDSGQPTPHGRLLAAETGFALRRSPDTVRAPDVAFVRWERCPSGTLAGFAEFAPDLVVEVLSPSDRAGEVMAKVADWLTAGTEIVWLIDPARRSARVYRADGSASMLREGDALDGEAVLPGLEIPLHELFD